MDTESNVNYEAVLADLKAKRATLDAAIAGIEQMLGRTDTSGAAPLPVTSSAANHKVDPMDIPRTAFHGMRVQEAVVSYLDMVKAKQPTLNIVDGVKRGGLMVSSKLYPQVYTALVRLERRGEVVRTGDEWGLARWFPGLRKTRQEQKPNDKVPESPVRELSKRKRAKRKTKPNPEATQNGEDSE